ncbi:hypothetical protein G6F63_016056 [Rhizopus arrhizus]|nr:hypothetical protein G6F63_016056 [Rhizopus arrhizus]
MFVVYVGSILTTVLWVMALRGQAAAPAGFLLAISGGRWVAARPRPVGGGRVPGIAAGPAHPAHGNRRPGRDRGTAGTAGRPGVRLVCW